MSHEINLQQEAKTTSRTRVTTILGSSAGTTTTTKPTYTPRVKREESSNPGRLSNSERDTLMKEGRCFNCKEQGHMTRDCPKKRLASTVATAHPSPRIIELDNGEDNDQEKPMPRSSLLPRWTKTLGDTGADGYVFLNRELSVLLGKRFGLKAESIGQECSVRGFDGKLTASSDDVLLDCRRYRMIWPDEKTPFDDVASKMAVPTPTAILQKPKPNPNHQADANRRDRLLDREVSKTKNRYEHTRERHKTVISKTQRQETFPSIDISAIGGVGFNRLHEKGRVNKEVETFTTSLYEIDHIIDVKNMQIQDPEINEILMTLPKEPVL
ncbi:hypothetical protein PDIDSM_7928 [Penicillium digitatum]|nr:hypothetical protein PDIDSM_7928 [Penicillium digitatum]